MAFKNFDFGYSAGCFLGLFACIVALSIGAANWNWFRTSDPKTPRMTQLMYANMIMTLAMIIVGGGIILSFFIGLW